MAIQVKHNAVNIKNPNSGAYEDLPTLRGASAYEIAKKYGKFTGTEEEFAARYMDYADLVKMYVDLERDFNEISEAGIIVKEEFIASKIADYFKNHTNRVAEVTNAKNVTTIGTKAIDATELNPDVEGSLANNVKELNNEVSNLYFDSVEIIDNKYVQKDSTVYANDNYDIAVFDVSGFDKEKLSIVTNVSDSAYCKFEDEAGVTLSVFNTNTISKDIEIPTNSKKLYVSFRPNNISVDRVHVFIVGVSKTKLLSRKTDLANIKFKCPRLEIIENNYMNENGELIYNTDFDVVVFDVYKLRNSSISVSTFIEKTSITGFAFKDIHNNFISGGRGSRLPLNELTVPNNAKYLYVTNKSSSFHTINVSIYADANVILEDLVTYETENVTNYFYSVDKVLCIGDSLTDGAYYGGRWTGQPYNGSPIKQGYPYYLKRMINADVVNGGYSGDSAKKWYHNRSFTFSAYDSFIIWLGTNEGLTDTLDTDVKPYTNYNNFADTNTGCYCKIISKIKQENPDAFIVLLTIFGGNGHNPVEDSKVIRKIAELYNLPVIEMVDLNESEKPELHGYVNNVHFSKAGNIFVADRICKELNKIFTKNPLLLEYGFERKS